MWYVLQTSGTNGVLAACVLGTAKCRDSAIRAAVAEFVHQSDGIVPADCTFATMVQIANAEGVQIVVFQH